MLLYVYLLFSSTNSIFFSFKFFINFLKSICWFHTLSVIYDTYLWWSQRPQHNKTAKSHWQTRECQSISRPHLFIYSQLAKTKARTSKLKNLCGKKAKLKALSPKGFFYIMAIVVNYVSKVVLYFHICVTKKSTKSLLQEYNLLKHTFVDAANFWIKENQKEVILGDYL